MFFTLLLFTIISVSFSFDIVWNSPFPTNCPYAYKKNVSSDAISKFNIQVNDGNKFNGKVVTTMYNNPGRFTLGKWPCFDKNGTTINGGLPQLGNLTEHLNQVRKDIAIQLSDPNFSGYAVIDWEVWVPSFEILSMYPGYRIYYNRSLALAKGNATKAAIHWDEASMKFMVETLKAAQEIRPNALLGYYGMVQCTFDHASQKCENKFVTINDQWEELWKASSCLYPELYATCKFSGSPEACDTNSSLAIKIEARLQEAKRIQLKYTKERDTPFVGFTWYTLDNNVCTNNVGHCPLMKNKNDLHSEFGLAKETGADGIIVWGSSGDVRNLQDCVDLGLYVEDTLGPLLEQI